MAVPKSGQNRRIVLSVLFVSPGNFRIGWLARTDKSIQSRLLGLENLIKNQHVAGNRYRNFLQSLFGVFWGFPRLVESFEEVGKVCVEEAFPPTCTSFFPQHVSIEPDF
ncbi:hypothetical protein CBD41_06190 [bacterium TMED181]|nr:hypothetical protein [Planctomycetota bacterium]OUW44061.1 MAG: hypothetical protein CBD41_06190 [bacterium TMED181]